MSDGNWLRPMIRFSGGRLVQGVEAMACLYHGRYKAAIHQRVVAFIRPETRDTGPEQATRRSCRIYTIPGASWEIEASNGLTTTCFGWIIFMCGAAIELAIQLIEVACQSMARAETPAGCCKGQHITRSAGSEARGRDGHATEQSSGWWQLVSCVVLAMHYTSVTGGQTYIGNATLVPVHYAGTHPECSSPNLQWLYISALRPSGGSECELAYEVDFTTRTVTDMVFEVAEQLNWPHDCNVEVELPLRSSALPRQLRSFQTALQNTESYVVSGRQLDMTFADLGVAEHTNMRLYSTAYRRTPPAASSSSSSTTHIQVPSTSTALSSSQSSTRRGKERAAVPPDNPGEGTESQPTSSSRSLGKRKCSE